MFVVADNLQISLFARFALVQNDHVGYGNRAAFKQIGNKFLLICSVGCRFNIFDDFVDGQNTIGTQIVCFGWPFFLFQLGDWDLCRRSLFIEREVEKEKRCHSFLLIKNTAHRKRDEP